MENLHELLKEMLNKANLEVLRETGKLKTIPEPVVKKVEPVLIEGKQDDREHGPDEDEDNLDRQARKERIKDIKAKAKAKLADKKPVNETNVDDPTIMVDTTAVSQIDDSDQKLAKKNWRKYFPRPSNKIKDDAEIKAVLAGKPIRETAERILQKIKEKSKK
jgi:hypothetical protein